MQKLTSNDLGRLTIDDFKKSTKSDIISNDLK